MQKSASLPATKPIPETARAVSAHSGWQVTSFSQEPATPFAWNVRTGSR